MAEIQARPEVAVYWRPGCSMCLNSKEYLERQGIPFESVNVMESPDAMQELAAHGFRGLPVIRKGKEFLYVQSLDVVAEFLGMARGDHDPLSVEQLLDRWNEVLERTRVVIAGFDDQTLLRPAILNRPRPVRDLSSHVFQIPEVFVRIIEEGLVDTLELQNKPRKDIVSRADLVAYVDRIMDIYQRWWKGGGASRIPDRILTYYGDQPSYQVLERAVWHSAQHARQLDTVSAGLGNEFQIPTDLYANLPMPKRLWA